MSLLRKLWQKSRQKWNVATIFLLKPVLIVMTWLLLLHTAWQTAARSAVHTSGCSAEGHRGGRDSYLWQFQEFVQPLRRLNRVNDSKWQQFKVSETMSDACSCHITQSHRLGCLIITGSLCCMHGVPLQTRMRDSGPSVVGRGGCCLQVMSEIRWNRVIVANIHKIN